MTMDVNCSTGSSIFCDPCRLDAALAGLGLVQGDFQIEAFWQAIDRVEELLDVRYVRMDFGVPGLNPPELCVAEHIAAIRTVKTTQYYPPSSGVPILREVAAEYMSCRLGVQVDADSIFVTCGATQALFVAQALASRLQPHKSTVVFLAPVYPPMASQAHFLGLMPELIELDGKQGTTLADALRTRFQQGDVCAVCWASPGNPSWRILSHDELALIAALCQEYEVLAVEDLTYLGMTGRHSVLPSISAHAERYFQVFSSSKMLSYAGERVGFVAGAPSLLDEQAIVLQSIFGTASVRRACESLIFNMTAGAPHSAQYAVAGVLRAVNNGRLDLDGILSAYARRAAALKALLLLKGFYLIYEDPDPAHADGFYVCFGYPGLDGFDLVRELLYCGITVLPLAAFGSQRHDGVRACVGRVDEENFVQLQDRLAYFDGRVS